MRVLITNDDGIEAPGLRVVASVVKALGWDGTVVAPATHMSGASRSFRAGERVYLREYSELAGLRAFTTRASPAACVLAALGETVGAGFDLCVSGINNGENLGAGLTISGTFGAAVEAAIHGIPSVAMSLEYGEPRDNPAMWRWAEVEETLMELMPQIIFDDPAEWLLANVNLAYDGLNLPIARANVSSESYFSDAYDDESDAIQSIRGYASHRLSAGDDIYWFAERHRNTVTYFTKGHLPTVGFVNTR